MLFFSALVGSLTIGTTFAVSPVAGILTDRIGLRKTTLLGGALASLGMLLSSFLTSHVECLFFTYGIMFGLGAALAYTPSLAVLGHYFHKYLGLVNGVVTCGSSVFTVSMPFLLEEVIKRSGLQESLWLLAALSACIMPCALLFVPVSPKVEKKKDKKKLLNVSIWKNKRYLIWAVVIPLALFGYFVPYVHMNQFVKINFPQSDGKLPVVCIGITSGIGRLLFGYIADMPRIDRILLQQSSFISIGLATMFLPFCQSFMWLLIITLAMGLFDGCFISLLGPIAFDLCGQDGATQAIGFLLGLCSVPLTFGPPIAGLLYDHTGTYQLSFLLAGVPPLIGAVAMFLIRCVKEVPEEVEDKYLEPLALPEVMKLTGNQAKLASAGRCTRCILEEVRLWEKQKQYNTLVL